MNFLAGRIVDSQQRPIPKAVITLRGHQTISSKSGEKELSKIENKYLTDEEGNFRIEKLSFEDAFNLDVEAKDFIERKGFLCHKLPQGSYELEQSIFKNNIIELQRPGKISGKVLDANGNPLTKAELTLYSLEYYPKYETNIVTDSNGEFSVEDLPMGNNVLVFRKINAVTNVKFVNGTETQTYTYENIGPGSIIVYDMDEGQEIKDAVLDLSKSTAAVELEIKDASGLPVSSAKISIIKQVFVEGGFMNCSFCSFDMQSEKGLYSITKLPAGVFNFHIYYGGTSSCEVSVSLTENTTAKYKIQL